jgi:hypothetical protein
MPPIYDQPKFDFFGDEVACLKAANESPAVKAIDAKITDLARNWRPSGFYSIPDLKGILDEIDRQSAQAQISLATTILATGDAPNMLRQAQYYLDRNKQRVAGYRGLIADAEKRGLKIVDAPGLKDAVLKSMVNISHAYTTKAAIDCRANWLDKAAVAVDKIGDVAGKVAGFVADVAIAAGGAAADAARGAVKALTVLKWAAIIGVPVLGGLWAYSRWNEYVAKQRAFRSQDEGVRVAAVERSAAQREQARIAKALKAQSKAQAKAMKTPKAEPSALPPAAELISPVANS